MLCLHLKPSVGYTAHLPALWEDALSNATPQFPQKGQALSKLLYFLVDIFRPFGD